MSSGAIRPATPDDAAAIARVHAQSWRETYRGLMPDSIIEARGEAQRIPAWQKILTQPRPPLVAHVAVLPDAGIVGFISGGPAREPSHGFSHEITALYILKSGQGRGLGRALVARLTEDVLGQNGDGLYAWVLESNPACGFYRRLGGERITTKIQERGAHRLPEVMYGWRALPSPAARRPANSPR